MSNVIHVDFRPDRAEQYREEIRAKLAASLGLRGVTDKSLAGALADLLVEKHQAWGERQSFSLSVDLADPEAAKAALLQMKAKIEEISQAGHLEIATALFDGAFLTAEAIARPRE